MFDPGTIERRPRPGRRPDSCHGPMRLLVPLEAKTRKWTKEKQWGRHVAPCVICLSFVKYWTHAVAGVPENTIVRSPGKSPWTHAVAGVPGGFDNSQTGLAHAVAGVPCETTVITPRPGGCSDLLPRTTRLLVPLVARMRKRTKEST
jgi:hypothetical protein